MSGAYGGNALAKLELDIIKSTLNTQRLGKAPGWSNELWDTIDSTNNRAAELIAEGAPEGVIVLARQQTAGRGRLGRQWVSPPDSGIYASFILRPPVARTELPFYTLACGVAAVRAVWECAGLRIGLKWVNDLIAGGKKVGGILAEMPSPAEEKGRAILPPGLVLGIGINLRLEDSAIPDELRPRIEWLERLAGQPIDSNLLLCLLAKHVEELYAHIVKGNFARIIEEWRKHSVTLGRQIRASSGDGIVEGTAVDISADGGLMVRIADGSVITLRAGEITVRGADGSYA